MNNLLGQEIPEELFHYTSMKGLLGVISARQIWATNIEYLNDVSEYRSGRAFIDELLEKTKRKRSRKKIVGSFFDALAEFADAYSARNIYVTSFSEKGDLLSQWRGYTPINSGYSIGFSGIDLELFKQNPEDFSLLKCLYKESEKRAAAEKLLQDSIDMWIAAESDDDDLLASYRAVFYFSYHSFLLAASFKNESFSEESEWRIVLIREKDSGLKFREGTSFLIPYHTIDLADVDGEVLPVFREVIIGPCPNMELAHQSTSRYIQHDLKKPISIELSQIPFRSW